jgi:competence protein ComEC
MGDLAAVVMAVAAAAGALAAQPAPVPLAVFAIAVALIARWPVLLWVGVAVAASGLSARSWAGLEPPSPRPFAGGVTLVGDPADVAGALRVDVRIGRSRAEAWARGRSAGRLRRALSGERVELIGHLTPVPETERRRLASRHVGARLSVESVGAWTGGSVPSRLANGIRRRLVAGAASLSADHRSLFAGFVLGDDRGQPPDVAYDFRASGLAHLLVVSGQNVAFVLALAGPLLRRSRISARVAAGVVVLAFFGLLTRWEPSVLRAVAMAGVTLLAGALGRPASTIRVLALAVTGLLLVDPLLVHSVGFRLSVGACAGIALWARPLASALPGPRPMAEALGVTVAAQAGVAPVLVPTFGGLPVAALGANLLALPAAGPLMVWGLAAGLPAGLAGGPLARLLHIPTELLLRWVAAVARVAAALPLGQLGMNHVAALAALVSVAVAARAHGHRRTTRAAAAGCAVVLALPAVAVLRPGGLDARAVGRGAALWREGPVTVLVLDGARGSPDRVLSGLHASAVRHLDLLVASRPGVTEARTADTVRRRFPARIVLAPAGSRLDGAYVPPPGTVVDLGPLSVMLDADHGRLVATVRRVPVRRGAGPRGPPR